MTGSQIRSGNLADLEFQKLRNCDFSTCDVISSKALPSPQQGLAAIYQDAREPDMHTFGQGMIHNLSSAGSDSGAQ